MLYYWQLNEEEKSKSLDFIESSRMVEENIERDRTWFWSSNV